MAISVCVYCGASSRVGRAHHALARAFGAGLAARGMSMVFGGGRVGLMGAAADACLSQGGKVIGVIPAFLEKREMGHGEASELHIVDTMHDRKAKMAELSDAFAILPGGFGTLDEFFEVLTWRQLGLHDKPILLVGGDYWKPLHALLDHIVSEKFAHPEERRLWAIADDVEAALGALGTLSALGALGAVPRSRTPHVLKES